MQKPSYITQDNYSNFKRLYQQAVEQNIGVFAFEGHTILVGYAKHVVDYVDSLSKPTKHEVPFHH